MRSLRAWSLAAWICWGESSIGWWLHIELQSDNDAWMALRMMEYGAKVALKYKLYPKQVVLYVGEVPLRMTGDFHANVNSCSAIGSWISGSWMEGSSWTAMGSGIMY
jgi:hypothetical protein